MSMQGNTVEEWLAKSRIMELRRLYGLATDLINNDTEEDYARGLAIYREIFTDGAEISATGSDTYVGAEAWAVFVKDALADYAVTQHLIGSQVVTELQLPSADDDGVAQMVSYLHAWHVSADDELWTFLGNYYDTVVHSADAGWQISKMHLEKSVDENRRISR